MLLVQLLTPVVENTQTFCQISQNLGEIPVGDETAIASLVQTIETILSEEICFFAIRDLGKIGVGNPIVIAALVNLMETTHINYLMNPVYWIQHLRQL